MTNCVICHKALDLIIATLNMKRGKTLRDIDFVCVCFDCIKKQNKL